MLHITFIESASGQNAPQNAGNSIRHAGGIVPGRKEQHGRIQPGAHHWKPYNVRNESKKQGHEARYAYVDGIGETAFRNV
jgi:hypothetical protein